MLLVTQYEGMKEAVRAGYKILNDTGSVLDALEAAVRVMEDNEVFNAGRGSKLNIFGHVEMDASIMSGQYHDQFHDQYHGQYHGQYHVRR